MPSELNCPATPPQLPTDSTPERVKLSPAHATGGADGGSPSGRASPDSACPICLGRLENKAFTDGCCHKFCFTCIVEWSKVRAVCPLCKQNFTSIIHNVRSELDYDRYRLPPPAPPEQQPPTSQHGFIYRPWEGGPAWLQARRHYRHYRSLVLPMLWSMPGEHFHLPPASRARTTRSSTRASRVTSQSRRALYANDQWARPTPDVLTGRYREAGPEFYRSNPACTHRLVPWLNRELNAVLDQPTLVAHVLELIMDCINRMHILSTQLRALLEPFMSPNTEHFIHEFYSYARSPYDMVGYDMAVQYRTGRPSSPAELTAIISSDSDSSDDIRVLTPPPRPRTPILQERLTPEPGPSGIAEVSLDRVRAVVEVADMRRSAVYSSSSESDDDAVQVVDVVPPRHLRLYETVTLSSDGDEPVAVPAPEAAVSGGARPGAHAAAEQRAVRGHSDENTIGGARAKTSSSRRKDSKSSKRKDGGSRSKSASKSKTSGSGPNSSASSGKNNLPSNRSDPKAKSSSSRSKSKSKKPSSADAITPHLTASVSGSRSSSCSAKTSISGSHKSHSHNSETSSAATKRVPTAAEKKQGLDSFSAHLAQLDSNLTKSHSKHRSSGATSKSSTDKSKSSRKDRNRKDRGASKSFTSQNEHRNDGEKRKKRRKRSSDRSRSRHRKRHRLSSSPEPAADTPPAPTSHIQPSRSSRETSSDDFVITGVQPSTSAVSDMRRPSLNGVISDSVQSSSSSVQGHRKRQLKHRSRPIYTSSDDSSESDSEVELRKVRNVHPAPLPRISEDSDSPASDDNVACNNAAPVEYAPLGEGDSTEAALVRRPAVRSAVVRAAGAVSSQLYSASSDSDW